MKMKMAFFFCVVIFVVSLIGCTVAPKACEEAVLVKQPWIFGSGGIDPTPVKTGLKYVAPSTHAVIVSTSPQQFAIHFDDLMSSDGVPLDFDSVIRLQVLDSVSLVKNFGADWYKLNVEKEFMNRVRQAVRKHGMNETAINTVAIDAIDAEVSEEMTKYLKEKTVPVALIGVTIGKANPPDAIKSQRIATAEQQQRILTEQQRKLAEDQRKLAEKSRAAADNAYREDMSLSPDQFLRLESIKMQREVCSGGKCTFLYGGASAVYDVK
ncbi:MAG: SPFH domain-containing protein [Patescibacteria group bacterium]|jgi:regulator of protease activity HflC (stomatin/prohibitin superfamily)